MSKSELEYSEEESRELIKRNLPGLSERETNRLIEMVRVTGLELFCSDPDCDERKDVLDAEYVSD